MALIPGANQAQQQQQQPDEVNDVIAISKGAPDGFVKFISRKKGLVWKLDDKFAPQFKGNFDPCSVSASTNGDLFVAERSTSRVCI